MTHGGRGGRTEAVSDAQGRTEAASDARGCYEAGDQATGRTNIMRSRQPGFPSPGGGENLRCS